MHKLNYLLIPILLILVAACSSAPATEVPEEIAELENLTIIPADVEPSKTIDFNRDAIYGDTEDVMLGSITSVAVDKEGRVFIADRDQNYIHVYESDGNYLQQVGSEGEGPGEFGNISRLNTDEEFLYGYDFSKRQVNVFQLESLEFSHTIPLLREDMDIEELSGAYPGAYYLRNDGTLLVGYSQPFRMNTDDENDDDERMTLYYQLDEDGNVVSDKVFEQRSSDYIMDRTDSYMVVLTPPYGRRSLLSVAEDDRIYSAWTEEFLVKIHNSDGSYERAIYYPYQKSDLDMSEVLADYEGDHRQMIRNDDSPPTWQAMNSLRVDDQNRMWISTITEDQEVYDWWIIDKEGELQAQFTWPRNRNLQEIKNGVVYTEETDEATGLEQVVKYSIELS